MNTDYTLLRELAGSWGTIFLMLSFVGAVLFALRPSARSTHKDSANIPFRHDDRPLCADRKTSTGGDQPHE